MPAPEREAPSGVGHYRRARARSPFVERMRVRVGMFVAWGMVATALVPMLLALVEGRWRIALINSVSCMVLVGLGLWMRRSRSVKKPGLVLMTWAFSVLAVLAGADGGLALLVSPWPALLALFTLYMLGPRFGVIFVGVALAEVGVALVLHRAGATFDLELSPWDSPVRVTLSAFALMLVGVLGVLYEVAQQRTQAELEQALASSEENEQQLDALIESATAAICSVDRAGRLRVHNRAFEVMAGKRRRPRPRDLVSEILEPGRWARWQPQIERVLAGAGTIGLEESPPPGRDAPFYETTLQPITAYGQVTGVTVFCRDITARRRADAELGRLNQELVRMSRQAGMAAVAGEVLHNAGNVLNSAGVSVSMLDRYVKNLRTGHLTRLAGLLDEHASDLATFLRDDARGQRVPELVRVLADHFEQQQAQIGTEVAALQKSIEHFIRVIHAQQSHARGHGLVETVTVSELVDTVLDLQAAPWVQLGITVERDLDDLPPLQIDKHRVLEILVNLVGNARHSLRDCGRPDKRLRIRAELVPAAAAPAPQNTTAPTTAPTAGPAAENAALPAPDETAGPARDRVRIHVQDNGLGIASEHRERLFQLGFTTKHDGSGIGLHSSANAAQQLGGVLSWHSDGPGQGATFTLELPVGPASSSRRPASQPGAEREPDPHAGSSTTT